MDGYLRATGIPVNFPAPNLKAGVLAGLQPIQFGGAPPVQIRALGGWDVPTSQPYIANALASLGGSIASALDERTKRKQQLEDKKAEREFKEKQAQLDRDAKKEIADARERIKSHSATESGKSEADDFFSESIGGVAESAPEGIEPELPKPAGDDGGAGFRALTQTPDPSADQSARGASKSPLQEASKPDTVIGLLEGSLIDAADRQPKVPKAIPVTKQGEPDSVSQQTSGLLEGSKAPEPQAATAEKGAPHGRGLMGEPNLRPPVKSGALKYPTTFKSMNQYMRVKEFMDVNPEYGFTLSGKPKYDPKRGLLVDTEYIDKSIESTKKQEREEKRKERELKSTREAKEHAEKISNLEGASIMRHPAFKNFEGLSGYRPMTKIFISAYDVVKKNPKAAGISDMELIDTYVRAATGGKPTEAQFHAAERKSWGEVLGLTLVDKPLTGARLSQAQRDQMLRTMLENYNTSAELANDVFDTVRQKMIKSGQTDEIHHPKDYVSNLMLKSDAENKLIENAKLFKTLQEAKKEAIRNNDKEESDLIDKQMANLASESDSISKRLKKEKYSRSEVLGIEDFKHKKQGYVGGAGGFIDFGSLQSPEPQVNVIPDNR